MRNDSDITGQGKRAPSDDSSLKTLQLSRGSLVPGFSSPRTSYAVTLPHSVEHVSLTLTLSHPGASGSIDGKPFKSGEPTAPFPLAVGRNPVRIVVIAEDGTAKTLYQVKLWRAFPTPNWVKVAEAAPWSPRDSAGELVFGNKMWLFGGYTPELVSDVWSSPDAVQWTHAGTVPTKAGINIPVSFAFNGRMWVTSNDGQLFASQDGARWELVAEKPPWSGRYAAGSTVFDGRLWVMGGMKDGALFNDVWSSADGVNWKLELAEAPWSPRQLFSNLVAHAGNLWLIGGGITVYQPFKAYADVWCSPDGRNWTKVTDEAPWPTRIWSSCAVYRDRIWLLGGFRAQPTWNNFNDLWHSADGEHWKLLLTGDIWEPRHEISAYVFDDKLWVIGGNAWPLKNDAWSLHIAGLTFVSQPVVEEFVQAQYSYRAAADFSRGGGAVRYRLVDAPSWLTMNPESGLVRGRPPATGDFPVAVVAYGDAGETARQAYTLHVIPPR